MKHYLLALAFAFSGSTAMAADAIYETPVPPVAAEAATPVFSWSGPYAGIAAGGGFADGKASLGGLSEKDNFDGGRFGVFAGYQHQFDNNFVLGLEGDVTYDWNDNKYDLVPGIQAEIGTNWGGSVRARAGYAFDRAQVYATGGWAITRGELKIPGFFKETETYNGYTVGAGVDYAVTDKVFLRGEYRFTDYGSKKILNIVDTDVKQHAVTVGLGVKF